MVMVSVNVVHGQLPLTAFFRF